VSYLLSFALFQLLACLNALRLNASIVLLVSSFLLFFLSFVFSYDSYVDRNNYLGYYELISSGGFVFVEPAFYLISYISKIFSGSPFLVFPLFASVGILLKIYVLNKMSPNIYLSILVYISYFYLLHDNAQIRIGAAMTFVLFALYVYYYLNFSVRYYFVFVLMAMMFHFSVVIFFVIPFLISRRFGLYTKEIFSCILLSLVIIACHLAGYSILEQVVSSLSYSSTESEKINAYVANTQSVNLYNATVKLFPTYLVMFFYLAFAKRINELFPEASVYARLLCLGALFFSLLAPFQIIAYRVFDLFYFFSIIFIPAVSLCFRSALARYVLVLSFSLVYFIYVHFIIDFSPI
jgi:hypothetical protein